MRDVIWLVSLFGIPTMHCFLHRLSTLRLAFFLWFTLAFHGPEHGQFLYCTPGDRAVFFNLSKYIVAICFDLNLIGGCPSIFVLNCINVPCRHIYAMFEQSPKIAMTRRFA